MIVIVILANGPAPQVTQVDYWLTWWNGNPEIKFVVSPSSLRTTIFERVKVQDRERVAASWKFVESGLCMTWGSFQLGAGTFELLRQALGAFAATPDTMYYLVSGDTIPAVGPEILVQAPPGTFMAGTQDKETARVHRACRAIGAGTLTVKQFKALVQRSGSRTMLLSNTQWLGTTQSTLQKALSYVKRTHVMSMIHSIWMLWRLPGHQACPDEFLPMLIFFCAGADLSTADRQVMLQFRPARSAPSPVTFQASGETSFFEPDLEQVIRTNLQGALLLGTLRRILRPDTYSHAFFLRKVSSAERIATNLWATRATEEHVRRALLTLFVSRFPDCPWSHAAGGEPTPDALKRIWTLDFLKALFHEQLSDLRATIAEAAERDVHATLTHLNQRAQDNIDALALRHDREYPALGAMWPQSDREKRSAHSKSLDARTQTMRHETLKLYRQAHASDRNQLKRLSSRIARASTHDVEDIRNQLAQRVTAQRHSDPKGVQPAPKRSRTTSSDSEEELASTPRSSSDEGPSEWEENARNLNVLADEVSGRAHFIMPQLTPDARPAKFFRPPDGDEEHLFSRRQLHRDFKTIPRP